MHIFLMNFLRFMKKWMALWVFCIGLIMKTTKLKFRYRIREGQVWLGTNAFFFQEGDEPRFANARYGEFRVDAKSGEAVLVGLRDAALKAL